MLEFFHATIGVLVTLHNLFFVIVGEMLAGQVHVILWVKQQGTFLETFCS